LSESEYKTISYFSGLLKISCKTLQKDLKIIEKYLGSFNIVLSRKRGIGIKIINSKAARWLLFNNLQLQRIKCKKVTANERRLEIIRDMLLNSNTVTSIQKLSDMYYVSKTSIVADISYIEEWLMRFNLVLKKSVKGTKLSGDEVNIRKALSMLMIEYSKLNYREHNIFQNITSRIDQSTFNALLELFDNDKIIYVNECLMKLEKKYSCSINDPYYINLLTHILISLTRGLAGKQINNDFIEDECSFKNEVSYKIAMNMVTKMNRDFGINLGEAEVYYLYEYFSSCGLIKNTEDNSSMILDELNCRARIFTRKITTFIEKIMGINISNDKKIMRNVFLHVRPMLNRLRNDIQITNPLLEDIEKEYPETLAICKAATLLTFHDLNRDFIPIDEIGYLAVYYQTAIERLPVKKRAVVVCQSGFGTSQLLMTRIKKTFPQWEISDVISAYDLGRYNLNRVDLVISTVPVNVKKPYIIVSAFLSDEDILNISNILECNPKPTNFKNVEAGIYYINKYVFKENVYFNRQDSEVLRIMNKKCNHDIKLNDISFSERIKIKLAFTNNLNLAINFKSILDSKEQIVFYIMMDDTSMITEIISAIYYFYKAHYTIKEIVVSMNKYRDGINCIEVDDEIDKFEINDVRKVLKKETIKFEMNARTKAAAIAELSLLLKDCGIVTDLKEFLNDINKREALGITGIGSGIAIPHVKSRFVNKTVVAIGKSRYPIQWESLDNKPVYFIILFVVKEDSEISENDKLISKIATMLGDDEVCKSLLLAEKPEDIYKIFSK
jgi:fructose-specific phosphotransferase system IIA component